jgi:hypothetical protein
MFFHWLERSSFSCRHCMHFHCRDVRVGSLVSVNFLSLLLLPAVLKQRMDWWVCCPGRRNDVKANRAKFKICQVCGQMIPFNRLVRTYSRKQWRIAVPVFVFTACIKSASPASKGVQFDYFGLKINPGRWWRQGKKYIRVTTLTYRTKW